MNRYFACLLLRKKIQSLLVLWCFIVSAAAHAATYNLSTGSYPPCIGGSGWSVSGSTYTCGGNGRVTLAAGDIVTANATATIFANNGFSLAGNTIGSSTANINLTSNYGTITATGTNTIYGAVNAGSGVVTLTNTTINGTLTSTGNINLTGGGVTGLVTSSSNTITTNGTNLGGGARAQSGMSITGGTLAGNFVMTANNTATFSGVTMTSGSISGASTVTIQNGSVLGSSSSAIAISSTSGAITVDNSTVYGNLTAPNYSTVNVNNGGAVYGTCVPGSTPANACGSFPSTPMNCPAGVASGITGNYFNNRTLTSPSTASRSDAPIDFTWGSAAPGPSGINADNFSVRWSGYLRVTQSGAYRFQTVSDDGVRLYINGTAIIDRWNDHSSTTDTTGDINLVAGQTYAIVLEFYENAGDAIVQLQWRLPGASSYVAIPGGPTPTLGAGLYECMPVAKPPISSCATGLSAGITGNYFNNQTLTSPVVATRLDGPINFDWGTGAPGPSGVNSNNFSVRWSGYVRVNQAGIHRFQTNSDDGVRLTVNGDLLIDQWNDHSVTTHTSAAVNLEANKYYPITLEFYENGGYAVAQLLWQTPSSSSYVAIPIGNAALTNTGLYQCITVAGYKIAHSGAGITCAGETITFTAIDTAGADTFPSAGTKADLTTTSGASQWYDTSSFTFDGSQKSFTKVLRQPVAGTVNINIKDNNGVVESSDFDPSIVFADAVLKFSDISTQFAGVEDTTPTLKAIKTDPATGVCVPQLTGNRTVRLAFSCLNPASCVTGQKLTMKDLEAAPNTSAAAPIVYNTATLAFSSAGIASIPLKYTDVGQVQLHAQVDLSGSTTDPAVTIAGSSNSFIVKPYTLAVVATAQTAAPFTANPATQGTGNGFIAAGEKFNITVQSRNAAGAITPNFGNETLVGAERNKIQLNMGCPERTTMDAAACATRKPDYPTSAVAGSLVIGEDNNGDLITDPYTGYTAGAIIPGVWDEVGSFRLEPSLSGTGYLGQGNVAKVSPSGVIGRFYPASFELSAQKITNSCGSDFSYMEHPNISVEYKVNALSKVNSPSKTPTVVKNYDNKTKSYLTAGVSHVVKDRSAIDVINVDKSFRLSILNTATWEEGVLNFKSTSAAFNRARNSSGNIVAEPPYSNILELGTKLQSVDPVKQTTNLNAEKTGTCTADCNAHSLGVFNEIRFGRLRLDDSFGSGAADLPVKFMTEFWTGGTWIQNAADSCTQIARSNIFYGSPEVAITSDANLHVSVAGKDTAGIYRSIDAVAVRFTAGDAGHRFSAPGATAEGSFPVRVNLIPYPWLMFDWNQTNAVPTLDKCPADSDCSLRATIGFGSYRGHDRVIYWRERFQ